MKGNLLLRNIMAKQTHLQLAMLASHNECQFLCQLFSGLASSLLLAWEKQQQTAQVFGPMPSSRDQDEMPGSGMECWSGK